jgi:hypothetical protein
VGINGQGRLGRKLLQKGLREPLLCEGCEQFLNDAYEKPFKKYWFDDHPLPKWVGPNGIRIHNIEYASFKLFHLSILFRSSVAKALTFSEVSLGPHETKIRGMVRTKDPGLSNEHPVFAFALVDKSNSPMLRMMVPPFRARFEGHIVYQTIFGGCMWVYTVSKKRSPLMDKVSLQSNGSLWLIPERWESAAALQFASKVMNNAAL